MAAGNQSQKDYLKKYLTSAPTTEGDYVQKKKKKKREKDKDGEHKPKSGGSGLKIIDEDATLKPRVSGTEKVAEIVELPMEDEDEDRHAYRRRHTVNERSFAPGAAEDDGSSGEDDAAAYEFAQKYGGLRDDGSGWVTVGEAGAAKADAIKASNSQQQTAKDNDLSRPRKRGGSPDLSPPRRKDADLSPPRRKNADLSPPRRKDADLSPPRRKVDEDLSPPRKRDVDLSPPRKRTASPDQSPPRKRVDADNSPPRRAPACNEVPSRHNGSAERDMSPPRRRDASSDRSSPRRRDESPPRRRSPSADHSPPRRRHDSVSPSPPRHKTHHHSEHTSHTHHRHRHHSDDEHSPPRRAGTPPPDRESTHASSHHAGSKRARSPSPAAGEAPSLRTGLHKGEEFAAHAEAKRKKEAEALKKMGATSAPVETIVRDKRGRVLTSLQKFLAQQEGKKVEDEESKMEWGKGLVQKKEQEDRKRQLEAEAAKPFARHADDAELNEMYRDRDRWGDPMLDLLRKKRTKKEQSAKPEEDEAEEHTAEQPAKRRRVPRPMFRGTPWINRFNILPGYRWDGIDRSNGWEAKRFRILNEKQAKAEDAYKWSSADM